MALITANDVTVLEGSSITMPLQGVWIADLVVDKADGFTAGTNVTIKAADGIELKGTVAPDRAGELLDAMHVRVLGGAGGMAKTVQARAYVQPQAFVRDVLNGILGDAGETLSSDVPASLTGLNLTAWSVLAQPASQAIGAFLDLVTPGNNWRILSDGKFWTGTETWPTSSPQYDLITESPSDGLYVLGVDSPAIAPGVQIEGIGKVARVEHEIGGERIRTRIWADFADEARGARAAIASIVRQEIAGIDHYTLYDARVDAQSADGATVDVTPVDKRLAGMQRVPLRLGLPGSVARFAPGKMVRIGWSGGDPRSPYACLFDGGETVTEIQIAGTGVPFIAGSSNQLGTLSLVVGGSATLAWTYTDANGVITTGASGQPITLTGKKATKVKLG